MNDENEKEVKDRKPYEAPKVIRVSLRPDEAVLGHCKIPGSAGPASASCSSLFCRTLGS
jgi:hypothetical protein